MITLNIYLKCSQKSNIIKLDNDSYHNDSYLFIVKLFDITNEEINNLIVKYRDINISSELFTKFDNIYILKKPKKNNDLHMINYNINSRKKILFYKKVYEFLKKYSFNYNIINEYTCLQKNILIHVNKKNYELYDIFNCLKLKDKIPIIFKKELNEYNRYIYSYRKLNDNYNKLSNFCDKFNSSNNNIDEDNYITFKYKINNFNYIDILILFEKKIIKFNYKNEYGSLNDFIIKILNDIDISCEYFIEEKNIDYVLKIYKKINVNILYYIFKTNHVLKNIFIINEKNLLALFNNFLEIKVNIFNIEDVYLYIKENNINTEIRIKNVKNNDEFNILKKIVNIIFYIYKNYNIDNINIFLKDIEINLQTKNKKNKNKIKELRNFDPELFISGYSKYASLNFHVVTDNSCNDVDIVYRDIRYRPDYGYYIKLKKNTKLPNKDTIKEIITSCKKNITKNKNINNKYKNKIYKYKYTILQNNIYSEIDPLFLKYFDLDDNYLKYGINEENNSIIKCQEISTKINITKFINLNYNYYNINLLIINYINQYEINIENYIKDFNLYKKTILVLCYHDLNNLNIKKLHYELIFNRKFMLDNNNPLVKKILKELKKKEEIKYSNILGYYKNKNMLFVKINFNKELWISSISYYKYNTIKYKNIENDNLITFSLLKRLFSPVYYDIVNHTILGCWVYYNNILVYIPVKKEKIKNDLYKNLIKHFILNRYLENTNNSYNPIIYFIYDMIILLFNKFTKENGNLNFFKNKYLYKCDINFINNLKFNENFIINTKIDTCENIINYYKNKFPYLFYNDKIKVNKFLYENIDDFILNNEDFKPIFFTNSL